MHRKLWQVCATCRLMMFLAVGCGLLQAVTADDLPGGSQATPVTSISLPVGFRAQLVRSAQKNEGSWISMTFDDRGRLILGRDKRGVVRLTLSPDRDQVETFEVVENTLQHCRGVLYAHESLYVCATNSRGFYRLRDSDGDDRFEEPRLLKFMDYQSRYGHGTNQVLLGPDEMLYVVNGNDVGFPEGVAADSPYRDPQDEHLLPEPRDAVEEVRVGHILRTDPQGKHWEVISGGFRNQFDAAFNSDGELFTYDADMEWDAGLPWYRPTRLNHVIAGGEYGWRWGTGKWPTYFADSLPSTLDTGLGSPTGVEFGTRSHYPHAYRESLYLGDWQNGRILRVQMTPRGATYDCRYGVFLEGGALNVCDLTFGPDGAMYFITGGRGSQSGLYRVSYDGPAIAPDPMSAEEEHQIAAARESRALRHQLEVFQRRRDPQAVDFVWPHLNSSDRWLQFAARLAVERQDPAQWRQRALKETRPRAASAALLAFAHLGNAEDQADLLDALNRLPLEKLPRQQQLAALRVWALSFIRQGRPSPEVQRQVIDRLNPLYPHASSYVNRELCRLLIYLNAPGVVPRTVKLIQTAASQEDAVFHAQLLARVEEGWTPEIRANFFDWLITARSYSGGKLVDATIQHIKEDAVATLSAAEMNSLSGHLKKLAGKPEVELTFTQAPIVKQWSWEELEAALPQAREKRSPAGGRQSLVKASCIKCHRFGEQGTSTGPDLTRVGGRFDERALLESIVRPSKVIDEKYRLMSYVLDNGTIVTGRPVRVVANEITLQTDPLRPETVNVPRAEIEESYPSKVSPMPQGLANVLTLEEILDLIAYLKSGGGG